MFGRRGDIFDDFDREFEEMHRLMAEAFERMRTSPRGDLPPEQPVYYGVSVNIGPDGVPHVEQFGNVRPRKGLADGGVREPFVTSFLDEERQEVHVTAEMPGVDKQSVEVEVIGDQLRLRAKGEDRTYEKTLQLAVPVDEASAKARYNNGVLQVTLAAKSEEKPTGRKVKVE